MTATATCEDYVLQKRKMLMQAGWPREALLVTVVRDKHGDGHAILTVKTDKGEYILDNQTDNILLWADTGYRFVKRQSHAIRSECLGLAPAIRMPRRPRHPRARPTRASNSHKELRVPGHVPTPPRPQTGFARGRLSPRSRPHLFQTQENQHLPSRESVMGRNRTHAPQQGRRVARG